MGETLERPVDRGKVALDDRVATLGVRLLDERLDLPDRLVGRQDPGKVEETWLHHRVDPAAHAGLGRDGQGVDHPQVDVLVDQESLDTGRQVLPDLVRAVRRVEQQRRPVARGLEDLGLAQQAELVAGDEVGLLDEVGRADRFRPEAQMGHGDRARTSWSRIRSSPAHTGRCSRR